MSEQRDWKAGRGSRGSGYRRGDKYRRGGGKGKESSLFYEEYSKAKLNCPRPPGLRGKALGLWHRDRARNIKKALGRNLKEPPTHVALDRRVVDEIWASLDQIKAKPPEYLVKRFIPPSPVQSRSNFDEDTPDKKGQASCSNSRSDKYSHLEESKFKTTFLSSINGTIEEKLNKVLSVRSELSQNHDLDEMYLTELENKNSSSSYQEMMKFRMKLPSYSLRDEIIKTIESNQVVVISGETGCGKTTQVGQFILDNEIMKGAGSKCHIVCTQPRRISAISVAERVAEERDEKIGTFGSVGYQIRLEKALPRSRASILYCTTGILLQYMQSNPGLTNVSHIIIDEIHERDTLSDFTITILKDVLAKRRDLKLILMSATLNAERFSQYYNNCPMLTIPGFTFPVTEYYLEDVLEMTGYVAKRKNSRSNKRPKAEEKVFKEFIEPYVRDLRGTRKYSTATLDALLNPEIEEIDLQLISELLCHICFVNKEPGAILVFLPGWDKISALSKLLNESGNFPSSRFRIIPLHSMMPTSTQKSIFNRPPPGVRKIVIATNIAETSITIDDIVYVIDCGKVKMKNFDVENNISTLQPEWVSVANARQRRGRAGRVQAGVCYHLFSKAREMSLANYPLPEMLRTRLEEVILHAKILQLGYVKIFLRKVLDPPDPAAIELSIKMLIMLNALDESESLTPLGYHLAQLPVDPQAGKMILMSALFSCVDPIFSIAASLSFKDPFIIPLGKERAVDTVKQDFDMGRKSDHLVLAEVLSQWELAEHEGWGHSFCQRKFLSRNTLLLLKDMKKQFAQHLHEMKFLNSKDHKSKESNLNSNNVGLIRAIIASSLYPNIAYVRKAKKIKTERVIMSLMTAEDGKVGIHPKSVNGNVSEFESKFLAYHEKLKSTKINLYDTSMVHPLPLLFFGQYKNQYEEQGKTIIELTDMIRFSMSSEVARVITELRIRLDWLLEKKVSNPGMIDWSKSSDDGCILRAITGLITIEDRSLMDDEDVFLEASDDDDDDDDDDEEL